MNEQQPVNPNLPESTAARATTQRSLAERGDQLHCHYCGSPLSSMFYFCTSCGTPYKDIETMLVPSSPPILTESDRIQLKAPAVWPLFWTYVAVLLGVAILTSLLFTEDRPELSMLFGDAVIFVTTCIFAAMYWRSLNVQFKTFGFNRPEALMGFGLLIVALAINFGYFEFLRNLLGGEAGDPMSKLRESGVGEMTLVICYCVLPGITEEIAFRGLLQHWLATAIAPMRALILASFLFAILHFNLLGLPYLFAVGMLLGWVKWKTGSLYPGMLLHFLHNLVVIEFFN